MITTHTTCQKCYNVSYKSYPRDVCTVRGLATSRLKGKRCYMTTISSCQRNLNSSPFTLREALDKERYAIFRDPAGCIFVASASDGYMVSFSYRGDTPIKYQGSFPYIIASDRDFYRTYADLVKYLQPQSKQAGWETVPVISNGKEVM